MAAAAAHPAVVYNAAGKIVNSIGPRGRGVLLDQMFEQYPRDTPVPVEVRLWDDDGTSWTLPANQADADMAKAAYGRVRDFVLKCPYAVLETDKCARGPDLRPIADSNLLVHGPGGARVGGMDACVLARDGVRGGLDVKLRETGNGKTLLAQRPDIVQRWLVKKKRVLQAAAAGHPLHGLSFVDFILYFEHHKHVEARDGCQGGLRACFAQGARGFR